MAINPTPGWCTQLSEQQKQTSGKHTSSHCLTWEADLTTAAMSQLNMLRLEQSKEISSVLCRCNQLLSSAGTDSAKSRGTGYATNTVPCILTVPVRISPKSLFAECSICCSGVCNCTVPVTGGCRLRSASPEHAKNSSCVLLAPQEATVNTYKLAQNLQQRPDQ